MARVAVIGLGQMGRGIARALDGAGLLVAARDLRAGAVVAAGLSDRVTGAVEAAEMLLFAVPSVAEIKAFFGGGAGQGGQLVIDVTTSDPRLSRALAGALAGRGIGYVDAAMTGGASAADAGTLTLMIGGTEAEVAACAPVFDAISARRFHLGPVGSGHAMKLVHNMILHAGFMATCEGLRLAGRAGLDLARAVEVLNAGNARSFVTEVRFPRDILSGTMNARSRIANLEKDLGLAVAFAADHDAPAPFAGLTHALLARAVAEGQADTDFSRLFEMFDDLAEGAA